MLNLRTSQNILKEKVANWLGDQSDWLIYESFRSYKLEQINVAKKIILFGDFACAYLQLSEMGIANKEIWVLCHKAKKILESLSAPQVGKIKVIDRYELFPLKEERSKRIDFKNEELTLVYGGRISRTKNIKLLVCLANSLQKQNSRIKLKIFGEYDDLLCVSTSKYKVNGSYKSEVLDLISSLEWVTPPEILHGKNEEEWLDGLDPSNVCVNLSTYWSEDFSVSVAQCQSRGLAAIVSDIGGHSDVAGSATIHIPSHLLFSEIGVNDDESCRVQAEVISKILIDGLPNREASQSCPNQNFPPIQSQKIGIIDAFDFLREPVGSDFFESYEKIWHFTSYQNKKILFLKSTEQNHWNSLVRISRQIELAWLGMQDVNTQVIQVDTDAVFPKAVLKELLAIDVVVAQALGAKTIKLLKLFREKMGAKFKLVCYPHELASVMYAGLKLRGLEDFFNESDIFVNHCQADIELGNASFEKLNTVYIPGGFNSNHVSETSMSKKERYQLCYVGRVSEQKNLHTLFWSISLIANELREKKGKLHIYGHHDHFGSPNFGVSGGAYIDQLGKIATILKIEDLIEFHGHVNIKDWSKFLKNNDYLGVFPGIHCDENFGYAPFDFLCAGLPVVLTNWGGYRDLSQSFGNASSVHVYNSQFGPFVNPLELAQSILNACTGEFERERVKSIAGRWNLHSYCEKLKILLSQIAYTNKKLKRTNRSQSLEDGVKASVWPGIRARGWMLNGQIFNSYSDDRYNFIAQKYGAIKPIHISEQSENIIIAPWVEGEEGNFLVRDPLKGEFVLKTLEELVQLGQAFLNPSKS